jgi:hypothetical protein
MCGMCPDYVDTCYICPPLFHKSKGYPVHPSWYLSLTEDTFCEHLTKEHGTSNPGLYKHIQWEHDTESDTPEICDDECIKNGWYKEEEILSAIKAYNSNSE